MDDAQQTTFDEWAILEVMGHSRFAGRVTDATIGGGAFVRIDVPELEERPAFTKFFSPGSIFAITPCTEQTARTACKQFRSAPFAIFESPMTRQLRDDSSWDDDDGEVY